MFWKSRKRRKKQSSDDIVGVKISDEDLKLDLSNETTTANLKSYVNDNIEMLCQESGMSPLDFYNKVHNLSMFNNICKRSLTRYKSKQDDFDNLIEKLINSDLDTIVCRLVNWVHDYEFSLSNANKKKAILTLYKIQITTTLLIKMYSIEEEKHNENTVQKDNRR